jgi:hypothetical protein
VRGKAIIIGAMGVVAVATLTANAQNTTSRTSGGSVATLLAATTRVAAEREDIALAARATTSPVAVSPSAKPEEKTEVETKSIAPRVAISAACQSAITHLKDLHTADVAEDAQERAALKANTLSATTGDQAEDAAEAQQWKTALLAARTACIPAPLTACRDAISGLQTVLTALHTQELAELPTRTEVDWMTDLSAVRTAFSAVQTACPERE